MDERTIKALEGSIKHWQDNVNAVTWDETSTLRTDCALCNRFWYGECDGCPVKEKTGNRGCNGSPYEEAHRAHRDRDWKLFKEEAQKELDFLISLHPNKEKYNPTKFKYKAGDVVRLIRKPSYGANYHKGQLVEVFSVWGTTDLDCRGMAARYSGEPRISSQIINSDDVEFVARPEGSKA